MRPALSKLIGLAFLGFATLTTSQASAAYTCMNPAICRAVCGSETCGKISARDPDMKALQSFKPAGQIAASANSPAARKPYTCMNPAICKAVCGSTTC